MIKFNKLEIFQSVRKENNNLNNVYTDKLSDKRILPSLSGAGIAALSASCNYLK